MKILFLTNIPSPYRIRFFNELGKTQNVKVVFEAEKAPLINNRWYSNNNIENFEAVFLKDGDIEEKRIDWRILKNIKKNNQDVIVVTNYAYFTEMLALMYLKFKGIRYYLEVDGGIIKNDNKIKKWYKTILISGAYGYISPSKQTDEYLIYYGADKRKIYRYNFTSLGNDDILEDIVSTEEKLRIREKLGMKEDKIILSVGQFIYRKGFDLLLKASDSIDRNWGIYIVGGEPTNEYLELKESLNLTNVHFVGFKNKDELREYYLASDVFVHPTREDIWGLVINEAMACGLPVITTDKCVAGLELISDNENGFIIPSNSEWQLTEKIRTVLINNNISRNMSKNSIKKISNYTIENMAKRHIEIFERF